MELMEEKEGHERYHSSPEALLAEIVAPRAEKSGGDICLQGIRHKEDQSFSAAPIEEGVVQDKGFMRHRSVV